MARNFAEETRIGAILERLFASTPVTSSLVTEKPPWWCLRSLPFPRSPMRRSRSKIVAHPNQLIGSSRLRVDVRLEVGLPI